MAAFARWKRAGLLILARCPGCLEDVAVTGDVDDRGRVYRLDCRTCVFQDPEVRLIGWPRGWVVIEGRLKLPDGAG